MKDLRPCIRKRRYRNVLKNAAGATKDRFNMSINRDITEKESVEALVLSEKRFQTSTIAPDIYLSVKRRCY
jgi:hypothetical protein